MKIGIIGMGFVGETLSKVLEQVHEIAIYDKFKNGYKESSVLLDSEVIFICVPTPMKSTGEIDLSVIEDAIEDFKTYNFTLRQALNSYSFYYSTRDGRGAGN